MLKIKLKTPPKPKLKLKAKTKRKIKHTLTRKKLLKRKQSKRLTRALFIFILTVCAGSLAFASVSSHPVVQVGVRTVGPGGVLISAPVTISATTGGSSNNTEPVSQSGRGSWYALGLPDPDALTCASRTFPRGTYLYVTDLHSGRSVTCLVNDYGPAVWTGRVIDLSRGSFTQVDSLGVGTIPVTIKVVPQPSGFVIPVSERTGSLGYSLCSSLASVLFCENNRQSTLSLKSLKHK